MNKYIERVLGVGVVLYAGLITLNQFKFKYKSFSDWLFHRNPIIYYQGRLLDKEVRDEIN